MLKVKRVYDAVEEEDGLRILVDALWPRGIKGEKARIDVWLKEIAPPSGELRRWFNHEQQVGGVQVKVLEGAGFEAGGSG